MRFLLPMLILLVILGTGGFVWFAWHAAIAPIDPPARTAFAPALIEHGAKLAAAGNCITCHTPPGSAPFAGGGALQTPFGTIYSSNITPDARTGIGTWPEAAFRRAMREGVDRAGRNLYPAFPYDHFTRVTDADDAALYAYLMTRAPVQAVPPANELTFPFNIRMLVAGWKLLFLRQATFRPDDTRDAAWNHGAYLVQGLAHCGACHTPRNWLGAEATAHAFDGGDAQGWYAYALNKSLPAPTRWDADSLYAYLRHGWQARHGVAVGPMEEVTRNLAVASDDDVRAIAVYVASLIGAPSAPPGTAAAATNGPGEAIYRATCAGCHDDSAGPPLAGIDLALSTAMHAPTADNAANVVLAGIPPMGEQPAPIMPGFGTTLTDAQTGDLLRYLRAQFGKTAPWDHVGDAVQAARDHATRSEAAR